MSAPTFMSYKVIESPHSPQVWEETLNDLATDGWTFNAVTPEGLIILLKYDMEAARTHYDSLGQQNNSDQTFLTENGDHYNQI
jgi:hypothetical protein